ncbi:MAG TPA: histidine--tRNA ligase [Cytophagales bacterium]|nr:histidine--tRNA ligase [Cytophagales bacterium]HAP62957.1 histidine--tRNA ligase [Cytophagales bacterium]
MAAQKPTLPKGTRDFGPQQMAKRNYIFDAIRSTFKKFGYQPLETPSMENLSVLTGKYGDEGDQLLFKILNNGDFLKGTSTEDLHSGSKSMLPKISKKGLRYDLTVPFARYVVMNQGQLTFPFKRYQIQPVWRGDRPQHGRYQEFYQCDADVVGTESRISEAEIVLMIKEVFEKLRFQDYEIKINHRAILAGMTEAVGAPGRESEFCVAIDKLDKVGEEQVLKELGERGFSTDAVEKVKPLLDVTGTNEEKIAFLKEFLGNSEAGQTGLSELSEVWEYLAAFGTEVPQLVFDPTLARGLSYYTGCILEVKPTSVKMGSISGGGRYDNLTEVFGGNRMPGVGFSFGVDRIYDVLEELNLFPEDQTVGVKVMITNFDPTSEKHSLGLLHQLRQAGVASEIYPEPAKMKKQFNYADKKNIPFVLLVGEQEIANNKYGLKNMKTGEQKDVALDELLQQLQA